jgi:hypothetical protein
MINKQLIQRIDQLNTPWKHSRRACRELALTPPAKPLIISRERIERKAGIEKQAGSNNNEQLAAGRRRQHARHIRVGRRRRVRLRRGRLHRHPLRRLHRRAGRLLLHAHVGGHRRRLPRAAAAARRRRTGWHRRGHAGGVPVCRTSPLPSPAPTPLALAAAAATRS